MQNVLRWLANRGWAETDWECGYKYKCTECGEMSHFKGFWVHGKECPFNPADVNGFAADFRQTPNLLLRYLLVGRI